MKKDLCIATYNVRHAHDVAEDIGCIGRFLAEAGVEIAGLQEIDVHTGRMKGADTLLEIAKGGGYPYVCFAKAMEFDGGGYGIGIVSKYPILTFQTIRLFSGEEEPRVLCHAVIETGHGKLDFFNTHTSYESKEIRAQQFKEIGAHLGNSKSFLLTGDFNTADLGEFSAFPSCKVINRGEYGSFYQTGEGIDHIFHSNDFRVLQSSMPTVAYSDHYPILSLVEKG